MPVTYSTPQALGTLPTAKSVHLVGVVISTPTPGEEAAGSPAMITWKYKALNAAGNMVGEAEYTEPATQVEAEDRPAFARLSAVLKTHGYSHVAAAGLPSGGVLS